MRKRVNRRSAKAEALNKEPQRSISETIEKKENSMHSLANKGPIAP